VTESGGVAVSPPAGCPAGRHAASAGATYAAAGSVLLLGRELLRLGICCFGERQDDVEPVSAIMCRMGNDGICPLRERGHKAQVCRFCGKNVALSRMYSIVIFDNSPSIVVALPDRGIIWSGSSLFGRCPVTPTLNVRRGAWAEFIREFCVFCVSVSASGRALKKPTAIVLPLVALSFSLEARDWQSPTMCSKQPLYSRSVNGRDRCFPSFSNFRSFRRKSVSIRPACRRWLPGDRSGDAT
jgi:hypothetical protein